MENESERAEELEQAALRKLYRNLNENRWYPRRTMRFAVLVVLPVFLLFILAVIIAFGDSALKR